MIRIINIKYINKKIKKIKFNFYYLIKLILYSY